MELLCARVRCARDPVLPEVRAARQQVAPRPVNESLNRPLIPPDGRRVEVLVHGAAVGERAGRAAISEVGVSGGRNVGAVVADLL